jgi:hypothetical protein
MRKSLLSIIGVFALIVFTCAAITSCGHRDDYAYAPAVQQAPAYAAAPAYGAPPVIVAAPPAHDGLLTGLMLGHMLSNSGPSYHPAPVVRNTTIVQRNTTIVRPAIAAPRANTYVYRPSRSANFGSFRRR